MIDLSIDDIVLGMYIVAFIIMMLGMLADTFHN